MLGVSHTGRETPRPASTCRDELKIADARAKILIYLNHYSVALQFPTPRLANRCKI